MNERFHSSCLVGPLVYHANCQLAVWSRPCQERSFHLSGTKAQIARSPSKKRASFNTGRGKERVRTSSDTDKHVNRVTDTSKSLANKVTLSPSLDAGLASKH